MVTLAMVLFLLFSIILDLSMLTPVLFALALATSGLSGLAVRCCCPHHIYVICKTEAADKPVTNRNGSVLFVEDLMYDSLRAKIEQNKRE